MSKEFISSIWTFEEDNKSDIYNVHNLYRWYGRLPYGLVDRLIELYSKPEDKILANFSGSGTIALECLRMGRNVTGTEINPVAILTSKVKTGSVKFDINDFLKKIDSQKKWKEYRSTNELEKKWFTKNSLSYIKGIKEIIEKYDCSDEERNFLNLTLVSIIKKTSLVDSRCVNHIVLDKNKKEIDILKIFKERVLESFNSIKNVNSEFSKKVKANIVNVDARNTKLPNLHYDLVISHPPYLGNVDYTNINQLENYFFTNNKTDIREVDISTNNLKKYLEAMFRVIDEMCRVTKKDGYICIIIGDNRKNGELVPTFSYFIQHALSIGLKLEDVFIWVLKNKAGRGIKRHGNHIDHNYILVFKKDII